MGTVTDICDTPLTGDLNGVLASFSLFCLPPAQSCHSRELTLHTRDCNLDAGDCFKGKPFGNLYSKMSPRFLLTGNLLNQFLGLQGPAENTSFRLMGRMLQTATFTEWPSLTSVTLSHQKTKLKINYNLR